MREKVLLNQIHGSQTNLDEVHSIFAQLDLTRGSTGIFRDLFLSPAGGESEDDPQNGLGSGRDYC